MADTPSAARTKTKLAVSNVRRPGRSANPERQHVRQIRGMTTFAGKCTAAKKPASDDMTPVAAEPDGALHADGASVLALERVFRTS